MTVVDTPAKVGTGYWWKLDSKNTCHSGNCNWRHNCLHIDLFNRLFYQCDPLFALLAYQFSSPLSKQCVANAVILRYTHATLNGGLLAHC